MTKHNYSQASEMIGLLKLAKNKGMSSDANPDELIQIT